MVNNDLIISVIIPTLNRPDDLEKMLISLLRQTVLPSEIIIIDQSKYPDSKIKAEFLLREHNTILLKYIHNPSITGLTQARNRGIAISTGNIIFFFDDDVILKEDYIEKTCCVYEEYPNAIAVGGVITNYSFLNASRIKLFNNIFFLGIFHDERIRIFANYKKYTTPIKVSKISGGVASYKRSIFEQEMFDERFTGYSFGEDIDLSLRLRHLGIFITPHAQLEHKSKSFSNERKSIEKILFLQVSSWTYIYLKNISILQTLFFLWLLFGYLLRSFLGLIKGNCLILESVINGLWDGVTRYRKTHSTIN